MDLVEIAFFSTMAVIVITLMVNMLIIQPPIEQSCSAKFPPWNSTQTKELYDHCRLYPEQYGVKP